MIERESPGTEHINHVLQEGLTMALYVAICLLAALTAVADSFRYGQTTMLAVVWGTSLGLAVAHWFAFRLSSQLLTNPERRRLDLNVGLAQILGSVCVAILATVPIAILPASAEFDAIRVLLSLFIGGIGYLVARDRGSSPLTAVAYGTTILAVGLTVAVVKNFLGGH